MTDAELPNKSSSTAGGTMAKLEPEKPPEALLTNGGVLSHEPPTENGGTTTTTSVAMNGTTSQDAAAVVAAANKDEKPQITTAAEAIEAMFPTEISAVPNDQVVSWAKTLQSPTLPSFSPSLDHNKVESSHHGKGLQLSIERGRRLNKTTQRCMAVLQEMTSLYGQYSVALHKAGQMLPAPTTAMAAAAIDAGQQLEPIPLLALQKSMLSWAKDKNKVAGQVRAALAPLVQNYLPTHSDAIQGLHQRYVQCRTTCGYARRRALSSRAKCVKSIKEAEQLIAELLQKNNKEPATAAATTTTTAAAAAEETATTTVSTRAESAGDASANSGEAAAIRSPGRAPKRLEAKLRDTLKEAKHYEGKYRLRVKYENECVAQGQRLEGMALDTMQLMEEDRLTVFVNTMIKVMAAQKQALDAGVISLSREIEREQKTQDDEEEEDDGDGTTKKNHAQKLVKMFTSGTNSFLVEEETTTGVMDAETLGLPEEVGHLRDRVRAGLAARRERLQLSKTLSLFFETVVKASTKLGQSLMNLMKKESTHFNETLHVALGACEGAHVRRLWDGMTSFIEAEAQGCFAMADSLRNVRAAKLDSIILHGEKAMKATAENDDAAWKQLCEAARNRAKAENKYRQSSVESAKARERVLSLDTKSQLQPQEEKEGKERVGKRMQKGLANIVSLLPDGGDKAMKILDPSVRAQRGLKEADEKEAKEKQQLVSTVEATSAALEAYKADAEHVVARYSEEEKKGWDDIRSSIVSFAELAQKLLGTLQLESISDLQPIAAQSQLGMVADINDWRMRAQQELVAICVDCTVSDDVAVSGFQLEVTLHDSKAVDDYTQSVGGVTTTEADTKEDGKDIASDDDEDVEGEEMEPAEAAANNAEPSTEQTGDSGDKARPKRQVFQASSQRAIGPNRANVIKLRNREAGGNAHKDSETELFLTYFWPDPIESKNVPVVVDSFPCSFRDGAQPLPFQYGRVFVSSARIIFASWTRKKLSLKWGEVREIQPTKSFDARTDAALQIVCKRTDASEESCMVLDGFFERQAAVDVMEKLREEARVAAKALEPEAPAVAPGGAVPPDNAMQQMKVVVSKHLKKISVTKFHQIIWSEKEKSVYKPWLQKEAFDIEMGDWAAASSVGPWCKETYTEERSVKFKVKRKTHLYIGPPIANVVQTHRCRVEGNDKCVVSMTIEFEGIPYSDCFAVEVRWVALREGEDVKVECGLVVDFKKKTFLKKQIQSGTIEESTPVHKDFFKTIQAECAAATGAEVAEEAEEPDVKEPEKAGPSISGVIQAFKENPNFIHIASIAGPIILFLFWRIFLKAGPKPDPVLLDEVALLQRVDSLEAKIDSLQQSVDELLQILKESNKS